MEEVPQWGGRHSSEVFSVNTAWVSAVGEGGTVGVSVRDTDGTVGSVVTG